MADIHHVEIDFRAGTGTVQTLYAEVDRDTHERVVAAAERGSDGVVSVYARLGRGSALAPRVMRASRIVRVEPID